METDLGTCEPKCAWRTIADSHTSTASTQKPSTRRGMVSNVAGRCLWRFAVGRCVVAVVEEGSLDGMRSYTSSSGALWRHQTWRGLEDWLASWRPGVLESWSPGQRKEACRKCVACTACTACRTLCCATADRPSTAESGTPPPQGTIPDLTSLTSTDRMRCLAVWVPGASHNVLPQRTVTACYHLHSRDRTAAYRSPACATPLIPPRCDLVGPHRRTVQFLCWNCMPCHIIVIRALKPGTQIQRTRTAAANRDGLPR